MARTSSTLRRSALIATAVATGAGMMALSAGPAQAAASTTVGPAGHNYTASLVTGTTATFLVGNTTVTCNQSSNNGAVPAEPDNTAPAGPLVSTLTPALFSNNGGNCPTNVVFTTAKTVSNSTNGPWTIGLQYDEAGSVGTMTIPQAGVVTTISGLASCVVTVAPNGPVSFSGPWTNGTATTKSTLDFSAGVQLPIKVTGGLGCPTSSTAATFKARYAITDTTDATQQITVSAAVPAPTEPTPTEPTPTDPTPTEPTPTEPAA